jgi:hypothetical protein
MAGSAKTAAATGGGAAAAKTKTNLRINTSTVSNANAKSTSTSNTNTNTSKIIPTVAAVSPSALKQPLSNRSDRSVTFADWKQQEQYDQQVDAWRERGGGKGKGGGGGGVATQPFERTRLEQQQQHQQHPGEDESAFSTDQSSIMLTPLNRVRVNRVVRVTATATTTSSGSDLGSSRQVPRVELRGF